MKFDNSSGCLATAPFRLDKDELFYRDYEASDFDDVFGGKSADFDAFNVPTDLNSLFDDIDFEFFTNKFHPLDYLVDGKHNLNFQDRDVGVPSPVGSPISPLSFDEFSVDLLEPVDTEKLNIQSNMLENTPPLITPFEEDLKRSGLTELSEITGQPFRAETSSPMSTSSNHSALADHTYAKIPESDKDSLDLMSPKSVDSGISDDEYHIPDEIIADVWEALGLPNNDACDVDIGVSEVQTPAEQPNDGAIPSTSPRTRYSPYSKKEKTEEEKSRRKEHNRKSALKYRTKKKEKLGSVLNQVEELEKKNKELKTSVEELQSEIAYLKGLMRDVICARFSKKETLNMAKCVCNANS